jgi:hypothetical protein
MIPLNLFWSGETPMAFVAVRSIFIGLIVLTLGACASTRSPQVPQTTGGQTSGAAGVQPGQTDQNTYDKETVMKGAEGVFGKGAEGVGKVIEKIFADLGRPTAYIVGQEAGGAFIGGLRYGDGMLYHKVEGEQKVHWTGPSVGFDIGGDASKSFTLVYNLNDTQDVFQRYPAVEGKAYFVGGASVNYHQRGNIIMAPVRLGAGWRLGANIGYLHYTKDRTYNPF